MRIFVPLAFCFLFLASCGKDNYTTAPQIELKDISPNAASSDLTNSYQAPVLTFKVTDAEGDLGYIPGVDTAYISIKNLSTGNVDEVLFPSLGSAAGRNLKAFVDVNLFDMLDCKPGVQRPYLDTTIYEVYVTDFAGNKSNVITTAEKPVFFYCQ